MTPEEEQALLEQDLIEGDIQETPVPVDAKITLQKIRVTILVQPR